MSQAGRGIDEYAVEAGSLDHSFIGRRFGYNCAERTVYGTLAGVEMSRTYVTVWLADLPQEWATLRLAHSDTLYFSHATTSAHLEAQLDRIERRLDDEERAPSGGRRP